MYIYICTYTYTHLQKHLSVHVRVHMDVRVRVCFLLCGAVSCRVPRVVGCRLGVVWCVVVDMSWSWWSLSLVLPASYDEHFATGKSGAFKD